MKTGSRINSGTHTHIISQQKPVKLSAWNGYIHTILNNKHIRRVNHSHQGVYVTTIALPLIIPCPPSERPVGMAEAAMIKTQIESTDFIS